MPAPDRRQWAEETGPSLAQSAGLAVDALGALAGRAPEMLGETLSRLDDIVAAHESVLEPEAVDGLRREGRVMLASAAAEGLIARDADGALAALDGARSMPIWTRRQRSVCAAGRSGSGTRGLRRPRPTRRRARH